MAALAALAGGGPASAARDAAQHSAALHVTMNDRCDPVTFNAALGEGACVGDGEVTFARLNAELAKAGARGRLPTNSGAGHWDFDPGKTHVHGPHAVMATNEGGEAHSFTEVAGFGGGCVPEINAPLRLTPVAECDGPAWLGTIAPPGASVTTAPLTTGTHLFECLIHPWMRATVTVR